MNMSGTVVPEFYAVVLSLTSLSTTEHVSLCAHRKQQSGKTLYSCVKRFLRAFKCKIYWGELFNPVECGHTQIITILFIGLLLCTFVLFLHCRLWGLLDILPICQSFLFVNTVLEYFTLFESHSVFTVSGRRRAGAKE